MAGLEVSAFVVFVVMAALGFLVLAVALIFGDVLSMFGLDVDAAGDAAPGPWNGRVLGVFVTAFGGTGAIASQFGANALLASAFGLASGLVFGGAIYALGRMLYSQQASTDVSSDDLLFKSAHVTIAIPANGLGQVRVRVGEEMVDRVARSKSGEAIAANEPVVIEEVLGGVVVVQTEKR